MSERETIFTERFLCRFTNPKDAEALRRFGALLVTLANGAGYLEEGKSTSGASEFAAAAADLRRVAEYLEAVVEGIEGSGVEPAEAHLAYLAKGWHRRVEDLATAIEGAIAETEAGP